MKRIAASAAVVIVAAAFIISSTGARNTSAAGTYKIELDNAFGLVTGADFKVAGVKAGSIQSIDLDQKTLHAVVTVSVTQKGFGAFHSDAFCQSRPQSLIGEYFIDCDPGSKGSVLQPGSTIPVTRTQSTIPADLLNDIMRLPYRQRFSLIINELGAAVAGRSEDLATALRRAVPALTETDNLLNLLSSDSHTLQRLTADSDTVVTALANNSKLVQNWVVEANKAAGDTAAERTALQQSFHKLPTFLAELEPNMKQLGATADSNIPVLQNLNAASSLLARLFTDIPGFAKASLPSLRSLGQASITGRQALTAAQPTIADLNRFAKPAPELGGNLAITLHDLDTRSRAVEKDPRSPGGKGYTGLEALLQYVFNQAEAINAFGPYGHLLTVDAFYNQVCSPYTTPQDIANNLAKYQAGQLTTDPRSCLGWIGKHQPGVNMTDPSDPKACVPLPGYGGPRGYAGPQTTACKLTGTTSPTGAADKPSKASATANHPNAGSSPGAGAPPASTPSSGGPLGGLDQTLQGLVGTLSGTIGGAKAGVQPTLPSTGSTAATGSTAVAGSTAASGNASGKGQQAQQLLNYLLAP